MNAIILAEDGRPSEGEFEVTVRFEGGGEYPVKLENPLVEDPSGEALLAWYFEEHLRYPFLDRDRERDAVALLKAYGERLFTQVFEADKDCSHEFQRMRQAGFDDLRLEVVGKVDFHRLHWEALRAEEPGTPLGARVPIMRKVEDVKVGFDVAPQGPVLNVLVVTARPHGQRDVGYRTISRPLLDSLRKARVPVSVDLVRPGSWRALEKHLREVTDQKGSGWYRIVHFDVHGAVTSVDELRSAGEDEYLLTPDSSLDPAAEDAYLFFETDKPGVAQPVSTAKVANLLVEHRVPVAVMNACQSAMLSSGSEASLAQRLAEAGVPVSVGMAYSVTVTAAEKMMPVVYQRLAEGAEIVSAIHTGRRELFDVRGRRAYFDQHLDLEDWVLPVVFSQRPVELQPQAADPEQTIDIYKKKAGLVPEPKPEYGFVGRDLDVQAIERVLLSEGAHNELLIAGMAGAGKSTLLAHLAWWWQATGLVDRVFNFSYESRAWTVDQILQTIIAELLEGHEQALAQSLPAEAQLERVAALLQGDRHLLVLDNAESITAAPASIPHSLPEAERERLRLFLSRLGGGKTLVLVGSRGQEQWLADDSFGSNTYELGGLDPQAASILQERIITRHGGRLPDNDDERKALEELVAILGGYPLALTVVLPEIARTPPSAVLAELKRGGEGADPAKIIQQAVEFSHGRLDPTTQNSLLVLAPFTGVVPTMGLGFYAELLAKQNAVAQLGPLDLEVAVEQAIGVGLASSIEGMQTHIRLQPLFPYFLRTRLAGKSELVDAVAEAHHDLYQQLGPSLHILLVSHEADERALGRALMKLEYANLTGALEYASSTGKPLTALVAPLEEYLDQTHQEHARQQLLEQVIEAIGSPSTPERRAELAIVHNLAGVAALARHRWEEARVHHEAELALSKGADDRRSAIAYHQLGRVAQEQRNFDEAETHYRKALQIFNDLEDRYETADIYHQLGTVAQARGGYAEAEEHYLQALEIFNEFKDRNSAGGTHHQLGIVTQRQQRYEEAVAHYRESLDIKAEFEDHHGAAGTYHQLGSVAHDMGKLDEAEREYKKALDLEFQFDDRYGAGLTHHQLGIVTQEQQRFEEAESHYRKALEIKLEFNEPHSIALTRHLLGTVLHETGRADEAEVEYRMALATFVELGDKTLEATSLSQLGGLLTRPDRATEAVGLSLAALLIKFEVEERTSEFDLRVLKEQHRLLGPEAFAAEVTRLTDEGALERLLTLFDQLEEPPAAEG